MEGESPLVVEWISGRGTVSLTPRKIDPDTCVENPPNPPEKVESSEKIDEEPQAHGSAIDAFCPLCFSGQILNPVELHTPQGVPNSRACLACGECVAQWERLLESGTHTLFFPCPLCGCEVANPIKHQAIAPIETYCASPIPLNNPSFSEVTRSHSATGPWNQCGVCEEEKCVFMCLQCGFALCSGCQLATHTKGRFRQHEVLPVEKAWQRGPRKCSVHPDQTLDLFCQTCQVSVCITCCFKGSHRGDVVVPLPEIATATKEAMKNNLVSLTSAAHDAAAVEQGANLLMPMYNDRLNDVRGQVTSTFAALREALQQRETFLLEQLNASSQRVQNTIEGHANMALRIATAFQTSHNGLQKLLDTLNPVSLMDSSARIQCSYDAVSSFLNQRMRAVEGFTTKLGTQLRDPEARERLASFLLFPKSHLGTPAVNETSLCEYKELLSHLGHLDFIDDLESLWNASQTLSDDREEDDVGLSLDSANTVRRVSSTKDAITTHSTTQATSVKPCGKGASRQNLDIGFLSIEANQRRGIQLSAIDYHKGHISAQEGALQGEAKPSEEERPIFHFVRNHDTRNNSRDLKVEELTEVVNAQDGSLYPRKRPYPLSKISHDNVSKSSQGSQLFPQGPGLSRLDDERPHQAFARARIESFFEHNH